VYRFAAQAPRTVLLFLITWLYDVDTSWLLHIACTVFIGLCIDRVPYSAFTDSLDASCIESVQLYKLSRSVPCQVRACRVRGSFSKICFLRMVSFEPVNQSYVCICHFGLILSSYRSWAYLWLDESYRFWAYLELVQTLGLSWACTYLLILKASIIESTSKIDAADSVHYLRMMLRHLHRRVFQMELVQTCIEQIGAHVDILRL